MSRTTKQDASPSPMGWLQHTAGRFDLPLNAARFVASLVLLRLAVFIAALPLPFDGAHTWRQSDTLGVSLRYWLRLSGEGFSPELWLPAVLNLGDYYGIMPTEFPILNLIIAPAFMLGPVYGQMVAKVIFACLALGTVLLAAKEWRGKAIMGISGTQISPLLLVVGIASAYWLRLMPDFVSMLLAFSGLGCLWQVGSRAPAESGQGTTTATAFRGLAWLALGVLIKPTSIVVVALLLLAPGGWLVRVRKLLFTAGPAAIALAYYTLGVDYIARFSDTGGLYKVGMKGLGTNLLSFVQGFREFPGLITDKLLFTPGLPLCAALLLVLPRRVATQQWPAWLILGLQIAAIAALDGSHAYIHDYYFICCAPIIVWLVIHTYTACLAAFPHRQGAISGVLALLIALPVLDRAYFNARSYFEPFSLRQPTPLTCRQLTQKLPELPWQQNYSFRTVAKPFPTIGLCFGEREGSATARYGLYYADQDTPKGCVVRAHIGTTRVVDCAAAL